MTIKMKDEFNLPVKKTPGGMMPYLKDCNGIVIFVGDDSHVRASVEAINAYDANQEEIALQNAQLLDANNEIMALKAELEQHDDQITNIEEANRLISDVANDKILGLMAMVNGLRESLGEIQCLPSVREDEGSSIAFRARKKSSAQWMANAYANEIDRALDVSLTQVCHSSSLQHADTQRLYFIGDYANKLREQKNMSNSREMMNYGTMPYYQPYYSTSATYVIYVGRAVINEVEPAGPQIHLAPNHQEFTPPHKKNRRSKYKRSGK